MHEGYSTSVSDMNGVGMLMKDEAKAVEWYQKAAKAGSSEAAKMLQELGRNSS